MMPFAALVTAMLLAVPLGTSMGCARRMPVESAGSRPAFRVPVEYFKLENGLRVVLSEDHASPTVVVAVYYKIGFRIEPRNRTGFAHLFEHMMFQGSKNLGKMEFDRLVQWNGGILNGSTRFDFTNYFEVLPANKLETALWAEADRMGGLAVTQENLTNQQGVVMNEVMVNVLNRPYGGFPWLDMPQHANSNWHNAHNFYGELGDLKAATLGDVREFFQTYYAPSNAALVIVGDFDPAQAKAWVKQYFGRLPATKRPELPDVSEPRQEREKRASKVDRLAKRPALAVAYHVPPRNTPEHFAMGLLNQILLQGDDSLLQQELVKRRGLTSKVDGGINMLGNMFNYQGPMLWIVSLIHDPSATPDAILAALDEVLERVRTQPVTPGQLSRALVKLRSGFYDTLTQFGGFGRADLLACFALFDDDPARLNTLESEFQKVTPDLILRTAQDYLRQTNRTVLELKTAGPSEGPRARRRP
jgi:predicted Zn-dependent peptidase